MTHRKVEYSLAALVAVFIALPGCGKKEEPPPPPPPPKPYVPPAPDPVDIDGVRAGLNVDARVTFEQQHSPAHEGLARAIFNLSSALARKDSGALRPLLDESGKRALADVAQSWDMDEIEAVRVVYLSPEARNSTDLESATVVTAIQSDGSFVLVWNARRFGDDWVFQPMPASVETKILATDWDGKDMGEYEGSEMGLGADLEAAINAEPPVEEIPGAPMQPPGGNPGGGGGPAGG